MLTFSWDCPGASARRRSKLGIYHPEKSAMVWPGTVARALKPSCTRASSTLVASKYSMYRLQLGRSPDSAEFRVLSPGGAGQTLFSTTTVAKPPPTTHAVLSQPFYLYSSRCLGSHFVLERVWDVWSSRLVKQYHRLSRNIELAQPGLARPHKILYLRLSVSPSHQRSLRFCCGNTRLVLSHGCCTCLTPLGIKAPRGVLLVGPCT